MSKVRVRVVAKRLSMNASESEKNLNFQKMMRVFHKACKTYGIIQDYKDHEFFNRKCDVERKRRLLSKAIARGDIKLDDDHLPMY